MSPCSNVLHVARNSYASWYLLLASASKGEVGMKLTSRRIINETWLPLTLAPRKRKALEKQKINQRLPRLALNLPIALPLQQATNCPTVRRQPVRVPTSSCVCCVERHLRAVALLMMGRSPRYAPTVDPMAIGGCAPERYHLLVHRISFTMLFPWRIEYGKTDKRLSTRPGKLAVLT